ncbi:FG-GAP repeat domain-containing protein [Streptomyces zaomyceticus]|uniref:FG-GAP repeat domain-containing protein n=1 Tax=Streptomyces zaomyceticus TaxID=68286 RepID=UPI00368B899E
MDHRTRTPVLRPRRRLGAAVLVALAVTAGAAGTPAVAAPPAGVTTGATSTTSTTSTTDTAVTAGSSATGAAVYPREAGLWSLGRTGFLTWSAEGSDARWTRLSDGAVTAFPAGHTVFGSRDSDVIIDTVGRTVTLRDMAAGTKLFDLDLAQSGSDSQVAGAVRSALFVSAANGLGGKSLRVYTPADGLPSSRSVTGLPTDATDPWVMGAAGDSALIRYRTRSGDHWALVDLTTGAVTAHRAAPNLQDASVSATYVAWTEQTVGGAATVVALNRSTGTVQRIPLAAQNRVSLGLVGNWVTYGETDGLRAYEPGPLLALTARDLSTGTTRKLLDHVVSDVDGPDGTNAVRGGTAAQGQGLYRIAPGTGGVPVATLLAPSGEPTKVDLLGHSVPATIDLSRNRSLDLKWRLSRINVEMTVTLRNTRTGDTLVEHVYPLAEQATDFTYAHYVWQGDVGWPGEPGRSTGAPAGDYTWRIDARPLNGIGPTMTKTGSFTVVRSKPQPHDFDGDGSPDLLMRDTAGRLLLADTFRATDWGSGYEWFQEHHFKVVGQGYGIYDKIEATGDLGGSGVGDFVARDRAGVLWLYKGRGGHSFSARIRIGGGWGTYTRLTGGSDLTGDGRADLVAADKAGVLWLYRGTGRDTAPFAARVRIGGGWGVYDQLTAVGNLAGGAAGDLVARDRAGVLWLYLGNGNGTFAPRTRIGGGWGGYGRLVGIGDADRDGRPDLYTEGSLYRGTGDYRSPLRPREETSPYRFWPTAVTYDHFA